MTKFETEFLWNNGRDSINLVVGAILGAYLGLSITRTGLLKGNEIDFFALITFTAFAATAVVLTGGSWFANERRFAVISFLAIPLNVWLSLSAAGRLGVDTSILLVIYIAWVWLILLQVISAEIAQFVRNKWG